MKMIKRVFEIEKNLKNYGLVYIISQSSQIISIRIFQNYQKVNHFKLWIGLYRMVGYRQSQQSLSLMSKGLGFCSLFNV